MESDRRSLQSAQKTWGAYVPVGLLLVSSVFGDLQTGAKVAGTMSLLAVILTRRVFASYRVPGASIWPGLLTAVSPSIGLLMFGFTGAWILGVAAGVTVLAAGMALVHRHDVVALVTVFLLWITVWVTLLTGIFTYGDWRAAATWGGAVAVFTALIFAIGRLMQGYGLRSVLVAAAFASLPMGVVVWGIWADWRLAISVGLLPCVAGVGGLIFTHDYTDEP